MPRLRGKVAHLRQRLERMRVQPFQGIKEQLAPKALGCGAPWQVLAS
jgi:hypothetical protein